MAEVKGSVVAVWRHAELPGLLCGWLDFPQFIPHNGNQLVTPHPIRDMFPFLEILPCVNLILSEGIESLVAMILKRRKIGWCDHPRLLGGSGQLLVLDGQFSASIEAFLLLRKQLNCFGLTDSEFLWAYLLGEIFLSHRHDWHFGITVRHAK